MGDFMNYLSGLDADQRRAVLHTTQPSRKRRDRPLIVRAGPGAGKTRLLISCVGHAIATGVSPRKIQLLAFGNKAAREHRQRLTQLRSQGINCDGVTCNTFHGLALAIVREFYKDCGLARNFTIIRDDAVDNLLSLARSRLISKDQEHLRRLAGSELKRIFSYKINSRLDFATVLKRISLTHELATGPVRELYREYQRLKVQNNVVDFDDLLRLCLKLLCQRKIGDQLRTRYRRIFVDEYQDTSRAQALILQQLRPSGQGVTVVGDSKQAIFSFRGANATSLEEAQDLFSRPAWTISLTNNYRSKARTVTACNVLMADYGQPMRATRPKGRLPLIRPVPDGLRQAKCVAIAIQRSLRSGVPMREQAVLVRTLAEADLMAEELTSHHIPFVKIGGKRISERRATAKFVRVIRWLLNPADMLSGINVVQQIPGIGLARARAICEAARTFPLLDLVHVPPKSRSAWKTLKSVGRKIRNGTAPTQQAIQAIITWLKATDAAFLKGEKRILLETISQADDWLTYLDLLVLGDDDNGETQPTDAVAISTIHASKGREWEIVRILDVVNGIIPLYRATSRAEVNEERRLLFVAMSRAKSQLELFVPEVLHLAGHGFEYRSDLKLSSFLAEAASNFRFHENRRR